MMKPLTPAGHKDGKVCRWSLGRGRGAACEQWWQAHRLGQVGLYFYYNKHVRITVFGVRCCEQWRQRRTATWVNGNDTTA
jgi:hypothetical protein